MNKNIFAVLLFVASGISSVASAAVTMNGYTPLGAWQDPHITSFIQWDDIRATVFDGVRSEGRRPVLPGVSGRNLELLQDALARKATWKTEGSLVVARRMLSQAKNRNIRFLRGYMAEAIFIDRHPDYLYIEKPNAPQHDVYRPNPTGGRGIHTG